jgi:hypothetical protein
MREGLRVIAILIGGGFLVYGAVAVLRGALYDVEDGRVERRDRPVAFWLPVLGMTALGLSILSVGWEWPIADAVARMIGRR